MDRTEIKDALKVLRARGETTIDIALAAAIRSPWTLALFAAWTVGCVVLGVWIAR